VEKYCRADQATDDNIVWCMRFACWIPKATDTHSEYVILIAFPTQQWLHKCASMLHSMNIAHLVIAKHAPPPQKKGCVLNIDSELLECWSLSVTFLNCWILHEFFMYVPCTNFSFFILAYYKEIFTGFLTEFNANGHVIGLPHKIS
jgi:hypothetical protein